jgi:hypothetical protein
MASLARSRRSSSPFRAFAAGAPPREISLLGAGMGVGEAGGDQRCVHCLRTPLVGEVVHVYQGTGGTDRTVCALCRSRHREPPARTEIVHSSEHLRAVKARTRAA